MSYPDMFCYTFDSENSGRSSNFEFRFAGLESIPKAVRRYNELRGAELAELKRLRDAGRPNCMPRFCKVRRPGQDVTSMVTSRDLDVVTQLSLDSEPISNESSDSNDEDRNANDADCDWEGCAGISGVQKEPSQIFSTGEKPQRLCGGAETPKLAAHKSKARKRHSQPAAGKPKKRRPSDPRGKSHTLERLEELHREVCAELQSMEDPDAAPPSPVRHHTPARRGARPQRHRVRRHQAEDNATLVAYEDYHQPQPKWADIMPSAMMSQAIQVNVCQAQNVTPLSAFQFMEQHGSMEPEPMTPFFLEDSDLEHEYADRQGYLRFREPRPSYPTSDSDYSGPGQDPVDKGGMPCFVELEKRPHRVSLLRSLSPMRYTSQRSEETLRTLSRDEQAVERQGPRRQEVGKPLPCKARRGHRTGGPANPQRNARGRPTRGAPPAAAGTKSSAPTRASPRNPHLTSRRPVKSGGGAAGTGGGGGGGGGGDESQVRQPGGSTSVVPSASQAPLVTSPERQTARRRKPRALVVYSKSLEDLKYEKLAIYNKITMTQERIINALDKLQNSLLQLQVPHCNAQERQKRQRNAFEFCVRFSRNFLYPLKGMIDDVRSTTVASFNSATSNEACQRVVCVYGLMQQSLQTYQRQLRYFLLEKVPQKLSALIEMIYTLTNCCLDKGMLERRDPVVECLQERCTRFMSFIEDMQEERFKLARETLRRLQKHQAHAHGHGQTRAGPRTHTRTQSHNPGHKRKKPVPKRVPTQPRQERRRSHERYDLKMCLNDLKTYEPRLVPKERPQADKRHRPQSRARRAPRSNLNAPASTPVAPATCTMAELHSEEEQHTPGDDVQTQMQQMQQMQVQRQMNMEMEMEMARNGHSSSSVGIQPHQQQQQQFLWQQQPHEEQLHQALLDALRLVSQSQVQQVLDPLMRSLGAMLGEKFCGGGGSGSLPGSHNRKQ
ncbi:hypothetical protein KR009_002523 [Drosophila setifemur]|nr:hypothetical protein KR009_002523 [Drosophila setifemur]